MDLFYDGSQDVPLPFESGRKPAARARGAGEPGLCESCNALISAEDLESGAATEVYGLALCETCRERSTAGERIELYFCDRCQVSVPVYRVDTGEALAGDGRILCLSCREKKQRSRGLTLALALLLIVAVTGGVLLRWPTAASTPPRVDVKPVAGPPLAIRTPVWQTAALARRVSEAAPVRSLMESALDDLEEARDRIHGKLAEARESIRRSREDFVLRMDVLRAEREALRRDLERALEEATAER